MKQFFTLAVAAGALALSGVAYQAEAASPIGKTYKSNTGRHIKVSNCGGGLGMTIVKAAKKSHVGKRIMCGAKKTGANQWKGTILNVDDGKKYSGSAALKGTSLVVSGCDNLLGVICKTQKWAQVK
ncbi:MAG: DUF2147 domain-containing protein [Hyphomicrobiaceae bacterium]